MDQLVSVQLQVTYFNELAPRVSERNPKLLVFLDANLDREVIELNCHSDNGKPVTHNITVTGRRSERYPLPVTTRLVFNATCETENEFNQTDRVAAGSAVVMLKELAAQGIDKQLPLVLHSVNNLEKGRIHVRCTSRDVKLGSLQWDSRSVKACMNSAVAADKQMEQYLNQVIQLEQQLQNNIPGTENIRCPFYYGDVGMHITSVPLPAFAFTMTEPLKTNLAFWENTLNLVLRRQNRTSMPRAFEDKVMVAGSMMVLYVQYLDYIGDTADENRRDASKVDNPSKKHGAEKFGDALRNDAGDCEDLGLGINQVVDAFVAFEFPEGHCLQELQQIISQYVPFDTLDAVTAGQISNAGEMEVGAHLNCNLIPLPIAKRAIRALDAKTELPFVEELPFAKDLPVIIGEGTGMLSPVGYHDTLMQERVYVFGSAPSLGTFKKPITYERHQQSGFFLGILNGYTNYFTNLGSTVGGFWFTQGDSMSRGLEYLKLENADESIRIIAQPPVTKQVMNRIQEAVRIRVPPKPLLLNEPNHPKVNPHLQKVVDAVASWNRSPDRDAFQEPVPFYVRPHQIDDRLADAIIRDFQKLRKVYRVEYRLESVTDDLYGYQVTVFA